MVLSLTSIRSGTVYTGAGPHRLITCLSMLFDKKFEDHDSRVCFLVYDGIEIDPPIMEFRDAFEGKKYNQKFSIINKGSTAAFIRIGHPTSSSYKVRGLIRGCRLSAGLSIVRYVSYTYARATFVPVAWLPIYINDHKIDYKFQVHLSEAIISITPPVIDFGTVDSGCSGSVRMFAVRNDGSKGTRFAIDLGANENELIIEPSKGVIQPFDTMMFRIECLGTQLGKFRSEFWVKCDNPTKVDVQVEIISPQLQTLHSNSTKQFTLVDFSKTYYGTSSTRTLVVRNDSSAPTIFCIVGLKENVTMTLQEAALENSNYNDFIVHSVEGFIKSQEDRIYLLTYKPLLDKKCDKCDPKEKTSFCAIKIVRVPCTNLNEIINVVLPQSDDAASKDRRSSSQTDLYDEGMEVISAPSVDHLMGSNKIFLQSSMHVTVLLYGEAETPELCIRPTALDILNIPLSTITIRELLLTNKSSLPIVYQYIKVAFIEIAPKRKTLKPNESIEVSVKINASQLGTVNTKIGFDLLSYDRPRMSDEYIKVGHVEIPVNITAIVTPPIIKPKFNMGITPTYIREVGIHTDDVRFNTPYKPPRSTLIESKKFSKHDYDLIAFPNDMPKNLKPWRSTVRCRTICAGLPRGVTDQRDLYQLTKSKSALKHKEYSYYEKYTREEGERMKKLYPIMKPISDYHLTDPKHLLFEYTKQLKFKPLSFTPNKQTLPCIPLSPLQLYKIQVLPTTLLLGKVAPYTSVEKSITIINSNDFPIDIVGISRKPLIDFPSGKFITVDSNQEIQLKLTYTSPFTLGRSNVIVDVVVNQTHTFIVSVIADVYPKITKIKFNEIMFEPDEIPCKYIDVYNALNVPVEYSWHLPDSCFDILPKCASVPAYSHITCMVYYILHFAAPPSVELTLRSDGKYQQNLTVMAKLTEADVVFNQKEVVFKDIPINTEMEKTIALVNMENRPVTFYISNKEPLVGIELCPNEGILEQYAEQVITIRVKFMACIKFSIKVEAEIQMMSTISFKISGNVVFPKISFTPDLLNLRKIVADSFDRQEFTVTNNSIARASVHFNFEDYPEFILLPECEFKPSVKPITKIELSANEERKLYLHFTAMGASSYCIYLPYIISDIFGPPFLSDLQSLKPVSYLEEFVGPYKNIEGVSFVTCPPKLEVIKIKTSVASDILKFSKLELKFKYFPSETYNSETKTVLKILNASKDACKFCIRTDELCPPFFVTYQNGNEIKRLEHSIVCLLGPREWVKLNVEFLPQVPGIYQIMLPIYLKNYLNCQIFNNLVFEGVYPVPKISLSQRKICFDPVPLNCESECTATLKLEYHSQKCQLSAINIDSPDVSMFISPEKTYLEKVYLQQVSVNFKFLSTTARTFNDVVKISCTCGGEIEIEIVACADNCFMTTHAFSRVYIHWIQSLNSPSQSLAPDEVLSNPSNISEDLMSSVTQTTASTDYEVAPVFDFGRNYTESTFPKFPEVTDDSDYAYYMKNALQTLEEWIFYQGFYCKTYYKIPEGICSTVEVDYDLPQPKTNKPPKKKKTKDKVLVPKYIALLGNIIGAVIYDTLEIRSLPHDDLQRINYVYNLYHSAVDLVKKQGGIFVNVLPELLLERSDYITFLTDIVPRRKDCTKLLNVRPFEKDQFYLFSKQTWTDLLLQTYKVFVLNRIRFPMQYTEIDSNETTMSRFSMFSGSETEEKDSSSTSSNERRPSSLADMENLSCFHPASLKTFVNCNMETDTIAPELADECSDFNIVNDIAFWQELNQKERIHPDIYNSSETILLFWLEFHFNKNKDLMVKSNNFNLCHSHLNSRKVQYFDLDLNDGLVLIGVTYSYCPYLIPYLSDIYLTPRNTEESLHNASKLVQSWNMLMISLPITPDKIVYANPVDMIMLVAYLYEVFPTFFPSHGLAFSTGLSQKSTQKINLQNNGDFTITYKLIFFQNESEVFSVSSTIIEIPAHKKKDLVVTFFAKYVNNQNCTLMLNGETPKFNYAKSMVFRLKGTTLLSYVTTKATIPSPLYKVTELKMPIQAPYKSAAEYDIFYVSDEPVSVNTCKMISWDEDNNKVMPKRCTITHPKLICKESGVGEINLVICLITNNQKSFWFLLKNEIHGDFMIRIVSCPQEALQFEEVITVELSKDFKNFGCSCKPKENVLQNEKCPKSIVIKIPSRNLHLWSTAEEFILRICEEGEKGFWKQYLGTNVGVMIKKWLLRESNSPDSLSKLQIFDKSVTYNVKPKNLSKGLVIPTTTTIKNAFSHTNHDLVCHMSADKAQPQNFTLAMVSESGIEIRNYKINFKFSDPKPKSKEKS